MKQITTKTYPGLCLTCNGNGKLADCTSTTDPYRTCPVCNGSGTIMIAETTEDDENYLNDCIKRATPRLSKIKDVDEYLHEIKSGVNIKDELVAFLIWYQPDNEVAEDLIDKYLNNQP